MDSTDFNGNNGPLYRTITGFYLANSAAGADTVTATLGAPSSQQWFGLIVGEYSGAKSVAPVNLTNASSANPFPTSVNGVDSGPITTVSGGELINSFADTMTFTTLGTGTTVPYVKRVGGSDTNAGNVFGMEDYVQPSAGTVDGMWTNSAGGRTSVLVAAFLPSSSGSTTSTLSLTNSGGGSVTSNPAGINCGSSCSMVVNNGTQVTLTATPNSGYTTAWSNCGGTTSGNTCTTTVNANTTIGVTFTPPDTTPPSIPTNLQATAISSSQINLSWTASTDNVGVTGYKVYRGGSQIGTSPSTSYTDTGLTPSTLYTYTVSAYDAAGNTSNQSSPASATTQAQGIGNTYTAATCNRSDVNAIINGPTHVAVDGDTIDIPAGSCTWTTGVTVPSGVGISIIGAGAPNSGSGTTGAASSCSATAITDDLTSGGDIFLFQPTASSSGSRISCMKILGQSGLSANAINSPFAAEGTCNSTACPNLRIDNVTFDGSLQAVILNSDSLIIADNLFGVLDHNSAAGVLGPPGMEFINFNNSAWNGVGAYGDNSWTSADSFGTAKALYLENNSWGAGVLIGETEAAVPNGGEGGGRIVARYNNCNGCLGGVADHGTESNGRPRGGRQIEFYGNAIVCTSTTGGCQGGVTPRSGVAMMFGNSLTVGAGSWFNSYLAFVDYRTLQYFSSWGGCDGTGLYDDNDSIVYASGVATGVSVSGNTATITDSTKSWGASQWIPNGSPYAIHDLTTNSGVQITANTANTVSGMGWIGPPNFNVGDSYQILRATVCIDQPNRSGGTLMSGAMPSPTGWVNETLDPSYEWDDSGYNPVFGNADEGFASQMITNRDFYTDNSHGTPQAQTSPTSPFNGSSGVGFGTLANRPTTCTSGVGYWATDQGSWNQSGNGFGQGQLYVCTSGNTWTMYYAPFTYPYPLTANGLPNPSAGSGGGSVDSGSGGGGSGSSDQTPPTISLISPQNGSTVSSTVSVSASASDNIGVTKV